MKPLTDKEIEKLPYPVFDILKPHAKIYDMSKRYNARVGDNRTPLPIRWMMGLEPKNLEGMYVGIAGHVGHGHYDDEKEDIVMDPDAEPVQWEDDGTGTRPGGFTVLRIPDKVFTKDGMFFGHIYLKNSDGVVESSVDVWFKVLAGVFTFGAAAKYFISDYEKALAEFKTEWKKALADFNEKSESETKANQDAAAKTRAGLEELTDAMANYKSQVDALIEKSKQAGLFTQAEADAFKQSIIAEIDKKNAEFAKSLNSPQTEKIVDSSNWACRLPDYMANNWNAVVNSIPHGEGIFNFGLITDNHYQPDNDYAYRSIDHYDWFGEATKAAKVDAVIVDGDNTNGANYDNKYAARFKEELYRSTANIVDLLEGACSNQSDIFWLKGNHDSGAWSANDLGSQKPNPNNSLTENELLQLYHCNTSRYGEVRDNTSFYFYKDYPDVKIRLIGLNSLDDDDQLDADGNYAKKDINYHSFRQPQLNWLANTALKVPSDYQVILFFHTPLDGAFSTKNGMVNSGHLQSIIQAFIGGTSISINDVESKEPINGLNIDFTQQGPGVVIGIFNGHYHNDNYDNSLIPGVSMIEENASFNNGKVATRIRDTDSEDAWDLVSVNTKTRSVNMYRFGEGNDRHFNY